MTEEINDIRTVTQEIAKDVTAEALRRAIAGDFRVEREIGRGGMGVVYCAYDSQLEREVAIKTLPPHLAADPLVRGRFLREARTAAALSHPNIVPIFSAAERQGVVYFVMGLVNGESLAERIARTGPQSPRYVLDLLRELCDALGFAHARGVVHRDVKAENVLLDRVTGRAMVTDFGIARVAETAPLTATGTVLGTVQYMSPEQVSGEPLDGRSDLYSLGVLAFFSLTARFPFERSSASAIVVAHVNAVPPSVRSFNAAVPPGLDALVARLLAKSPDARFADASALRQALDPSLLDAYTGALVPAGAPTPPTRGNAFADTPVMSSTDAQQVWSRAAELQANTGMIVPPPSFTPPNDAPLVTRGMDAALIRESAVEAGIDAKYVDRALVERASMAASVIEPGELMQKSANPFVGARTKVEYVGMIDGEMTGDDFEEIADEVRRALGEMVNVSAVGRTLTINTSIGASRQGGVVRAVQMNVTSRNGRTQFRIYEDLSQTAVSWMVGLGVGAGTSLSALLGGMMANLTHSPPIVIGAVALMATLSFGTGRFFFVRSAKKKDAQLQEVLRRVIARARMLKGYSGGGDARLRP